MTKMIVFLLFTLPSMFGAPTGQATVTCTCPGITNLQKTGHTTSSISYSWDGYDGATQYKVYFYRSGDQYTSGYFYTSSTSYNFTSLPAGNYTFYFATVCGSESSGYVGVEDLILF